MARLILKKERWGLSWVGWLLTLLSILTGCAVLLFTVYPFFAVTQRVNSDVLVIEGWISDAAIRAAAAEFVSHHYNYAFTTGGPVRGMGGYTNDYNTSASVGAGRLKAAGVPDVQMVPSRVMDRDRTYGAAIALRDWFCDHNTAISNINVVTEDLHARRTRLLFQKAFGDNIAVGVIAVPNPDYDSRYWWRYSEGVRAISAEAVSYLYAKILFYPSESSRNESAFSRDAANSKP